MNLKSAPTQKFLNKIEVFIALVLEDAPTCITVDELGMVHETILLLKLTELEGKVAVINLTHSRYFTLYVGMFKSTVIVFLDYAFAYSEIISKY